MGPHFPAVAARQQPVDGDAGEERVRRPVESPPIGDADALAATLRRGLDDAALRQRVGAAGRQRVAERWSWKHCAQLTVDQYRDVLAMPANLEKLRRNGRLSA